jgi:predicted RNase H-like HicB family nuclease
MSFGYRYTLRQDGEKWSVSFPGVPDASTDAGTPLEARALAQECLITALMDTMRHDRPLPRDLATPSALEQVQLPSLVTAKLAVYQRMREVNWTRAKLAAELGVHENAVRRLLDLRHNSHFWVIDEALAKMNTTLQIDLPIPPAHRHAA